MQGNTQKLLNSTGKCRVITVDDLEKCFVEPFTDQKSRQKRSELCAGLRKWLLDVGNCGICLDVWIDGEFVTYEAMPEYVAVACVIKNYQKELNEECLSKFHSLVHKSSMWWLKAQYHCSVELSLLDYKILEKYKDWRFEGFIHYKTNGKRTGIFTISL